MNSFLTDSPEIVRGAIILGGGAVASVVFCALLFWLLKRFAQRASSYVDSSIVKHTRGPCLLVFPLIAVSVLMPLLKLKPAQTEYARHILSIILIVAVSWFIVRLSNVVEDTIIRRYPRDVKDNLVARKVYTQLRVFKRIVLIAIGVLALGSVLMTFEKVREFGTSILASAGILGVVLGFAAQRTLGNFLASLQVAVTEPIRIDDVVIVENEWGWIEEINITYVVVRIWDLRRMILPISYFTEKPFQNWTRMTADLLGAVHLYVDYTVPVDALREELHRILKQAEGWDGKVWTLQVTEATEHTMQLRALMSAPDSSTAWNLRCEVREKLIRFIQQNYPGSLPRTRAEVSGLRSEAWAAAPQERREAA